MNFNDEITNKAITVLATQTSLTKQILSPQIFWSTVSTKVSALYSQFKAQIMNTINGKLVSFDINDSSDDLSLFSSSEIDPKEEIESLQISLEDLQSRMTNIEGEIRYQIHQKLNKVERKTNQKIVAIAVISFLGFGGLGTWISSVSNPSIPVVNSVKDWDTNQISKQP